MARIVPSWVPGKRMMNPLYRAKFYIEIRAGMPDPAKEARIQRLRDIAEKRR